LIRIEKRKEQITVTETTPLVDATKDVLGEVVDQKLDLGLLKNTAISERLNLQLRAEFFNIFNHPNFALPNFFVGPGTSGQGLITQTPDQAQTNPGLGGGGPRVIQLAAKLTF
jgi:hypothetical protein